MGSLKRTQPPNYIQNSSTHKKYDKCLNAIQGDDEILCIYL